MHPFLVDEDRQEAHTVGSVCLACDEEHGFPSPCPVDGCAGHMHAHRRVVAGDELILTGQCDTCATPVAVDPPQ